MVAAQQGLAAGTSQLGVQVSGSLLASNFCGFGGAGQRWLAQLKPDPLGGGSMVEIEFEVTEDDIRAFADNYCSTAKTARRRIMRMRLLAGGIFLIWGAAGVALGKIAFGLVGISLGLFYALFYRRYFTWVVRRNTIRNLRSGRNEIQLGKVQLTLSDHDIKATLPKAETRVECSALEAIRESRTHVFVYLTTNSVWAIPKARILSGDLNAFVTDLRRLVPESAA